MYSVGSPRGHLTKFAMYWKIDFRMRPLEGYSYFHIFLENQEQNKLSVKSFIKDKAVEMYAKRGLESLRKHLKNSEPLVVGSIDKEKIKEHEFE